MSSIASFVLGIYFVVMVFSFFLFIPRFLSIVIHTPKGRKRLIILNATSLVIQALCTAVLCFFLSTTESMPMIAILGVLAAMSMLISIYYFEALIEAIKESKT